MFQNAARGGAGYKAAARELMLYLDPASNEVLHTWRNVWTGEMVEVAPKKLPFFKCGMELRERVDS